MFKILLRKEQKHDATEVYVEIIEEAIRAIGEDVKYISSADEIEPGDNVVTITVDMFFNAWRKGKAKFVCNWIQGVIPEEIDMWEKTSLPLRWANKIYYTFCEKYTLKRCALNFFVSKAMVEHYKRKYGYNKNNYFIMPCFNMDLQEQAFDDKKYSKPTFLYAGGLSGWQCFEPMVELYASIKHRLKDAQLSIFTKDQEEARKVLNKHNVVADIRYVPYDKLSEEIKKFKYGFIIREDNEVNRVATPTKMNSYLANGIIPIYSDVIGAFKENLSSLKYSIPLEPGTHKGIEKLYALEEEGVFKDDVLEEYRKLFYDFYNRDRYVHEISNALKKEMKRHNVV